MRTAIVLGMTWLASVSCLAAAYEKNTPVASSPAHQRNRSIGRGINFGNALEAPNEGDWGMVIHSKYIQAVADAGFDSVRLPICWSAHVKTKEPFNIDRAFLTRVDRIISECLERDLVVIITLHHFNDLYEDPASETNRAKLLSIWRQLAQHYRDLSPDTLLFEPLNEPHGQLDAGGWNRLIPQLLKVIRDVDAQRTLIIDVPDYGHHQSLAKLQIPEDETNCIVSVRYYLPYEFTHQGAHWASGSSQWLGTTWTGTDLQQQTVVGDMDSIKQWSDRTGCPITVGEFGSIKQADYRSRVTWTRFVCRQMEQHGMSWSYFDFGVFFRAYDLESDTWLPEIKQALIP